MKRVSKFETLNDPNLSKKLELGVVTKTVVYVRFTQIHGGLVEKSFLMITFIRQSRKL